MRSSILWTALCLLTVGAPMGAVSSNSSPASPPVAYLQVPGRMEFSGRLIARPFQATHWKDSGLSARAIRQRLRAATSALGQYDLVEHVAQTGEYIIKVPVGSNENATANTLLATALFQYVEPDWIVYPLQCPNDSRFNSQWHHINMQSCDGWDVHTGNPTTSVGICDTGIRTTHEDLLLHRLEGYNAVDRRWEHQGGNINPVHPHGTMTTGCAAGNGDNGVGISGMGWNLSHRMLRVSNNGSGSASISDLQHAARTAVENGDKVASVSYSGVDASSNRTTATYIKSIGGLLVWAAGNDGRTLNWGDRDSDDIIVAGATDVNDRLASFSAKGPSVDLVAPGVNVYTTDAGNDQDYESVSGTSFSTPFTAGLAALIWSIDPTLTPDEVEDLIKQGVDDLGANGPDNTFGYGRINIFGSLSLIRTAQDVYPDAFNVIRAENFTGGLAELQTSDDQYLSMRAIRLLSPISPGIIVEIDGTSPILAPSRLLTSVESAASIPGLKQTVELFNVNTNAWESIDESTASTSDNTIMIDINANADRFVDPSTGAIRMKLSYAPTTPLISPVWFGRVDFAYWTVEP